MWFVKLLIFVGAVVTIGGFGALVGEGGGFIACSIVGAVVGIILAKRLE